MVEARSTTGTHDEAPPPPATFRAVPIVALVAVVFLAMCLSPVAFLGGPWWLLMLIPVAAAVWVLRVRTVVDTEGVHARGVLRTRSLPWSRVATLRLADRGWVRAVASGDGSRELVLRGVRVRHLGEVGEASGGRITAPTPADAQAAAEHARELESVRMRVAALRAQQSDDESGDDESGDDEPDDDGGDEPGERGDEAEHRA